MAPVGLGVAFRYGTGDKGQGLHQGGRRALRQPRGLHVTADGSLLVADFGNSCVVRFGPGDAAGQVVAGEEGKQLPTVDPLKDIDRPLGAPEGEGFLLKRPTAVCADGSGRVLVLDTDAQRVQRFGSGGAAPTIVPPRGAPPAKGGHAPEAIKNPRGMFVDSDGSVVLCDTWSHRVLRFNPPDTPEATDPPTVLAGTPNSCGPSAEQLSFPSSAARLPCGALLVADTNNHRVQRFERGQAVGTTVAGSLKGVHGHGLGDLNMPTGICVDPRDGSLLVADRANSRVMRFPANSRAGDHGEVVVGPELVERPWDVAVGPDGAVFVSDERRGVVLRLEEGIATEEPAVSGPAAGVVEEPAAAEPAAVELPAVAEVLPPPPEAAAPAPPQSSPAVLEEPPASEAPARAAFTEDLGDLD